MLCYICTRGGSHDRSSCAYVKRPYRIPAGTTSVYEVAPNIRCNSLCMPSCRCYHSPKFGGCFTFHREGYQEGANGCVVHLTAKDRVKDSIYFSIRKIRPSHQSSNSRAQV